MAEGGNGHVAVLGDLFQTRDHGRNLGTGHGNVFHHKGGFGAGKGRNCHAAGFPDVLLLCGVLGHHHFRGTAVFENLFHHNGVILDLGGMAVHFDQQHGAGVAGQTDFHIIFHIVDGGVIQKFQGTRNHMGGDDGGHGLGGGLHVREQGHHGLGGLRRGNELQSHLAGNGQGAFTAHQKGRNGIAGGAFHATRTAAHQVAGIGINFHAHDVVFGGAVFQAAQTAGVFGHVAADGGHGHGARIRGIEKTLGGDFRGHGRGDDAGFHNGVKVFLIDFEDAVQGGGQDDDGIGGVRNGAAGKVGARAAHGHRQAFFIAQVDDGAELLGIGGAHHATGNARSPYAGIIRIILAVRFTGKDIFLTDDGLEFLGKGITQHTFPPTG